MAGAPAAQSKRKLLVAADISWRDVRWMVLWRCWHPPGVALCAPAAQELLRRLRDQRVAWAAHLDDPNDAVALALHLDRREPWSPFRALKM
jgi:hypothetical protein